MAFSKLFGIFTYSEDLTGFKEKALMSSGLRKSLVAMAVLGCCSGGTIAAACSNTRVNSEVTEQVNKPQKSTSETIAAICAEGITNQKLEQDVAKTCSAYIQQQQNKSRTSGSQVRIPEVVVLQ